MDLRYSYLFPDLLRPPQLIIRRAEVYDSRFESRDDDLNWVESPCEVRSLHDLLFKLVNEGPNEALHKDTCLLSTILVPKELVADHRHPVNFVFL